jgi:DNA-directed RNA polymerase subunit K/omega
MNIVDNLLKAVKNRYEAVIIASREARRLNSLQRLSGADQKTKVTTTALDRLVKGNIKWEYGTIEDLKMEPDLKADLDFPSEDPPLFEPEMVMEEETEEEPAEEVEE